VYLFLVKARILHEDSELHGIILKGSKKKAKMKRKQARIAARRAKQGRGQKKPTPADYDAPDDGCCSLM
jgi:hypothetical protein